MLFQLKRSAAVAFGSLALMLGATALQAQELVIARSSEQQSMDPQFSRTGPNQATAAHIFESLMSRTPKGAIVPSLAVSFENVDATTWEAKLRPDVKFHDGSPLTAEDIVFSLKRAPDVPNSPASFAGYVDSIAEMTIVDPQTIRFTTKAPDPNFAISAGLVWIVKQAAAENASNADFNSGKATIGTGPYKFVSWTPADSLVLARNEEYWGDKPHYKDVKVRFIDNDAARVAALLSGAVQLIDGVPPSDLEQLKAKDNIALSTIASSRLIYLALNQRDEVPGATAVDGKPLDKNPFQDVRVRQAISLMIDRSGITDRILGGQGEPTMNQVPEGMFGYNPDLKPEYDLQKAKSLLAEAGYADGFGLTINSSNDRFPSDADLAQALGQLFARGGLTVNKVETFPYSVYSKAATAGDYGAYIFSNGNSSGEAGNGLIATYHTYDKENKLGTLNRQRYSNPEFDKMISAAVSELDVAKREKMLQEAAAVAFGEGAVIPLYHQSVTWASTKDIRYDARRDERTLAMDAHPAN